jgi:hypothetical protein
VVGGVGVYHPVVERHGRSEAEGASKGGRVPRPKPWWQGRPLLWRSLRERQGRQRRRERRSCLLHRRAVLRCRKGVLHQPVRSSTYVRVVEGRPIQSFSHGQDERRPVSATRVVIGRRCSDTTTRHSTTRAAVAVAATTATIAIAIGAIKGVGGRQWHPQRPHLCRSTVACIVGRKRVATSVVTKSNGVAAMPARALMTVAERGRSAGGWRHEVAAAHMTVPVGGCRHEVAAVPMAMLARALAAATTTALDPVVVLVMATKEGIPIGGWNRTTEATTVEKGRLT